MADGKKKKEASFKRPSFVDGILREEKVESIIADSDRANKRLEKIRAREEGKIFKKKQRKQFSLIWKEDSKKKSFFDRSEPKLKTIKKKRLPLSLNIKWPSFRVERQVLIRSTVVALFLLFLLGGAISLYRQAPQLRGQVNGVAAAGQKHFALAQKAAKEMDVLQATEEFTRASQEIKKAGQILGQKGQLSHYWSRLPYSKREESTLINFLFQIDHTLTGLERLFSLFEEIVTDGDYSQAREEELQRLLGRIDYDLSRLDQTLTNLHSSRLFFPSQLENYQKDIISLKDQIKLIRELIKYSSDFLGYQEKQRYLLLFQNNAELRPTGGFIGTFGYLTIRAGQTKDLFIDQIYGPKYLQRDKLAKIEKSDLGYPKDIPDHLIPAKPILKKYRHTFFVQGTNSTPDFPTSAERALWSFEQVLEQPAADKVIALDPSVIVDILRIINKIPMDKYDTVLTAGNFRKIIQRKVDVDNPFKRGEDKSYNPKQILVDFAPKFFKKIDRASPEQKFQIFFKIFQNLEKKHILLYARDSKLEEVIQKYNLGGAVKSSPDDYLFVNLDSVENNKVNIHVKKVYQLKSFLDEGKPIKHQLKIIFDHPQQYGVNGLWVRVMVPYGSQFKSAHWAGQDISSRVKSFIEAEKQVFLLPIKVPTQSIRELRVNYQSSAVLNSEKGFQLYLQNQPGVSNAKIRTEFVLSRSLQPTNYYPQEIKSSDNRLIYQKRFDRDQKIEIQF